MRTAKKNNENKNRIKKNVTAAGGAGESTLPPRQSTPVTFALQ
ncbi:MAG TPA: hypothetical protein VHF65_06930 [Nitrososphaera sp.]|nr:hypothetical protein [Nitrososphaera sp.]